MSKFTLSPIPAVVLKITDIQVFDFTVYPDRPAYCANVAINDSFMIQWSPNPDQWGATWTIPHSDEACWDNLKEQDYAHVHYDAEELAEELGAMEGIQDLIDRKIFE